MQKRTLEAAPDCPDCGNRRFILVAEHHPQCDSRGCNPGCPIETQRSCPACSLQETA